MFFHCTNCGLIQLKSIRAYKVKWNSANLCNSMRSQVSNNVHNSWPMSYVLLWWWKRLTEIRLKAWRSPAAAESNSNDLFRLKSIYCNAFTLSYYEFKYLFSSLSLLHTLFSCIFIREVNKWNCRDHFNASQSMFSIIYWFLITILIKCVIFYSWDENLFSA